MVKPMATKIPNELLPEILDDYASGRTDTMVARKYNITTRTLRNYLRRSMAGDPAMICVWGETSAQFFEHIKAAHRIYAYYLDQHLRSDVLHGEEVPLIYKGEVRYVMIEECKDDTPETRALFGFPRDGILRDENGEKVVEKVRMPVPAALKIKVAESILPSTYAKIQTIEHKHENIIRIGGSAPEQVEDAPAMKAIEHSPRDLVAPAEAPAQVETAKQPQFIVASPAKDAATWEQWANEDAFKASPVTLRRADGSATVFEPGKEPVEIKPEAPPASEPEYVVDPVYGRIRADQKAAFDKLAASRPANAVNTPTKPVQQISDPPEQTQGGAAVEAKPGLPVAVAGTVDPVTGVVTPHAAPVAEAAAAMAYDWNKHPSVIEARNKFTQGLQLTAVERQIVGGNFDVLKPYSGNEKDRFGTKRLDIKQMQKDGVAVSAEVTTVYDGPRRVVI